jgi:hypothetical protein
LAFDGRCIPPSHEKQIDIEQNHAEPVPIRILAERNTEREQDMLVVW